MKLTDQLRGCDQHLVLVPAELGQNLALDIGQDISALVVSAEKPRRSVEADRGQMFEQRVDEFGRQPRRAPHGLSHAHDRRRNAPALKRDFGVAHAVNNTALRENLPGKLG
jgi:hypothetical protein